MAETIRLCSNCNKVMQIGFIPDFNYGLTVEMKWHLGEVKRDLLGGVKASRVGGIPVQAYRCTGCGFLEFFAVPKPG